MLERRPVETAALEVEAVITGVLEHVRDGGRVPHDLLGHAADVDAGAAEAVILEQRDPRAMGTRSHRRGDTAAAAANDDQIVGGAHDQSTGSGSELRSASRRKITASSIEPSCARRLDSTRRLS